MRGTWFFNSHAVNQYTQRTVRPVQLYQMEGGRGNTTDTHRRNLFFVVIFYSHAVNQYTERTVRPVLLCQMVVGQGNTTDTYRRNLFFALFFVSFLTPMQSTNIQSGQHGQYGYIKWKGASEIPQIQTGVTCYLFCLYTPMQSANTHSGQHGQYGYIRWKGAR